MNLYTTNSRSLSVTLEYSFLAQSLMNNIIAPILWFRFQALFPAISSNPLPRILNTNDSVMKLYVIVISLFL